MRPPALPTLILDLETTGTDVEKDDIVDICLIPEDGDVLSTLVHPGRPIPPEATKVHGITDAMVKDAPTFQDIAEQVQSMLQSRILIGYNSKSFDVPMLHSHLTRSGFPGIDPEHPQLDVYIAWQELERRTLANAVKRYLGREHDDSHHAVADAAGTGAVLQAMLGHHKTTIDDLVRMTRDADIHRWVQDTPDGWRWKFGKHKGALIRDTPGYVQWLLDKDFPVALKRLCQQEVLSP